MRPGPGCPAADFVLKRLLKRLAARAGFILVDRRHAGARYLEHPPRGAFDEILLRCFPRLHGLRFIQVGANDGRRADPLQPYIDGCAWHGIMLEPLTRNFADLRAHRGTNPRLKLWQAAVDTVPGRRIVYDLAPAATAGLPDWARGLGSFSRERLATAARELQLPDSAIVAEEIETVAWPAVWAALAPARCDVLAVDTEGYDVVLLRAADLAAHRPRVIVFEHACMPSDERFAFYRELAALGYEFATDRGDTIAHLPEPAP